MRSIAKRRGTGEIIAAAGAAWLGMLAVAASHWWTVADPLTAGSTLLKWGSGIPGWWGIGAYAGKETAGLVVWLGSWLPLHFLLRRWNPPLRTWTSAAAIGFALLLLLLWPPLYHVILGWPPAIPE